MPGVSQKFPPDQRDNVLPVIHSLGPLLGFSVNPDTGDVTVSAVMQGLRKVSSFIWDILGYLDVIDLEQAAAKQRQVDQAAQIAQTQQTLTALQSQVTDLRTSVDTLIGFFGVTIPAWINKKEVEDGDDMGISRPSAASLELTVEFAFDRQVPGFEHEDVISIAPPAGSLVKRGSTVTVTLNLEG